MGFSRQEYWSGLSCPPPEDLLDLGMEPVSPAAPALQEDSFFYFFFFLNNFLLDIVDLQCCVSFRCAER